MLSAESVEAICSHLENCSPKGRQKAKHASALVIISLPIQVVYAVRMSRLHRCLLLLWTALASIVLIRLLPHHTCESRICCTIHPMPQCCLLLTLCLQSCAMLQLVSEQTGCEMEGQSGPKQALEFSSRLIQNLCWSLPLSLSRMCELNILETLGHKCWEN